MALGQWFLERCHTLLGLSGKEKGTLPGSLSGRLAWGWTTRLFPPGQLKLHIFGSVSEREQDVLGGQELELGQGIHDVP